MTSSRKRNPLIVDNRCYKPDFKDRSKRTEPVSQVTLHTTGGKLPELALEEIFGRPPKQSEREAVVSNEKLSWAMAEHAADHYVGTLGVSTGFVAGYWGELFQTQDEHVRAWSAGIKKELLALYEQGYAEWSQWWYQGGKLVRSAPDGYYAEWCVLYAEATGIVGPTAPTASPLELTGGRHGPDQVSISIDFLAPPYKRIGAPAWRPYYATAGEQYTVLQYKAVRTLLLELSAHYGFPLTRRTVLPHSVTGPIERTLPRKHGPGNAFDPGPLNWDLLLKGTST